MTTDRTEERQLGTCEKPHVKFDECVNWRPIAPEKPARGNAGSLLARIANYFEVGGNWNPELMEHDKVRKLLLDCQQYISTVPAPTTDLEGLRLQLHEMAQRWDLAGWKVCAAELEAVLRGYR